MKNITVIIPIHQISDDIKKLLDKALNSITENTETILSVPYKLKDEFNGYMDKANVVYNEKNKKTDFCSLVNQAVSKVKTDWFSILEYDDVYTDIWFDNFKKYADSLTDVSVFLPLVDLIDYNENKFIGFNNEAPWASSFSNEIGYIDNDCLQNYFSFNLTGGIFKKEDWIEVGGLKSSIKLTFWYEFLLRLTKQNKKVFVIPKTGYMHYLGRTDSLMELYNNEIDDKESQFWINKAKEECEFIEERKINNKK